jgi:uncharacterized protein (TIGR03067 family)
MNSPLLLLPLLMLGTVTDVSAKSMDLAEQQPAKAGKDNLNGDWILVSTESQGTIREIFRRDRPWEVRMVTFSDKQMTLKVDGRPVGIYDLDPTKAPKTLDLTWNVTTDIHRGKQKHTFPGIYELHGSHLKICFDSLGAVRPTRFPIKANPEKGFGRWSVLVLWRVAANSNLQQLALGLHSYHDANNMFPPAMVIGSDGKPLYSWRVLILPYIEAENLYKQFKLDEPWDSPNNKPLLARMPNVFAAPGVSNEYPSVTHYQVLVGGGALFDTPDPNDQNRLKAKRVLPRGPRITDITDGTSTTFMIVEAAEAVPWSKPQDLQYDPTGPLPKLGGVVQGGFNCATADGAVHFLESNMRPDLLRALITKRGGEVVSFSDSEPPMQQGYKPPK